MPDFARCVWLISVMLVPVVTFAQVRGLPSDIDLRASFCMGFNESRIAGWQSMNTEASRDLQALMQRAVASAQTDLHRLRSYMFPKVSYLDIDGLIAAKNRGYADYELTSQQRAVCNQRCPAEGLTDQNLGKWKRCFDSCQVEQPATVRVGACERIDWLPF